MSFKVTDPYGLLNSNELDLLEKVDNFSYPLLGYANLAQLHDTLEVIISPELAKRTITTTTTLEKLKKRKGELEKRKRELQDKCQQCQDRKIFESIEKINCAINRIDRLRDKNRDKKENDPIEIVVEIGILGEYVRYAPKNEPKVILYIKAIRNSHARFSKWLLAQVYVHEMMHAYYDTDFTCEDHYIREVEEPLAELGMLRFMERFDSVVSGISNDALYSVKRKQFADGLGVYGFGAYLFEEQHHILFEEMLYKVAKPITSSELSKYRQYWEDDIYPAGDELEMAESLLGVLASNSNLRFPSAVSKNEENEEILFLRKRLIITERELMEHKHVLEEQQKKLYALHDLTMHVEDLKNTIDTLHRLLKS